MLARAENESGLKFGAEAAGRPPFLNGRAAVGERSRRIEGLP